MSIIYAIVSRDRDTILAEFTSADGNFQQFSKTVLKRVTSGMQCFSYDNFAFYTLKKDQFYFLAMADMNVKKRVAYKFLEDLSERFFSEISESERNGGINYSLNGKFAKRIQERMQF